jgi:hypothetical protein
MQYPTVNDLVVAIKAMKLDTTSRDEVEVPLCYLEILAREVTDLNHELEKAHQATKLHIDKIALLNDLAKSALRKKNIEAYLV